MKKIVWLGVGAGCLSFLSGCGTPVAGGTGQGPDMLGGATVALGAGGASYVGQQINSQYGGPVGAALGSAATAGVVAAIHNELETERQEAKLEGQRDGRMEVMRELWQHQTTASSTTPSDQRDLSYDDGVYDGVNYHSRTVPVPTDGESPR